MMGLMTSVATPNGNKPRVLVVEDDAVFAKHLKFLLEHYEYDVAIAPDLHSAIAQLNFNPQIVLLDLNLPDGDGTRLIQHMKLRNMTSRIAIVTGEGDHERLGHVKSFGAQALLQKPVDFISLLEQMRLLAA